MRRVTGPDERVGTVMSAPSTASGKVTGTLRTRSRPLRLKSGCSPTRTVTYRSPGGPPLRPGLPRPFSLIRWPSPTPGGTRSFTSRGRRSTPVPRQPGQGSSTTEPRPPHAGHGDENEKRPWLSDTTPRPPQLAHCRGLVPGLAPDPEQVWHVASLRSEEHTSELQS